MKHHHAAGLFGTFSIMVMAAQPAWAVTEVRGVRLNPSGGGVQVILDTTGGDRPQIFTVNRGNDVVADIINTQLRLPGGNSFRENNPSPGIASVVVTPLDANSIRVIVSGTSSPPQAQISPVGGGGITLSFNTGAANTATLPNARNPDPTQPPIAQSPDVLVPNPPVTINGPAPSSGSNQAPPFFPRAVAPPVGDIAVANTDPSVSVIDLATNELIPRLVLRDAPVRDVLALLARAAGLNLAFSNDTTSTTPGGQAQPGQSATDSGPKISLDVENEPVQDVFNYILRLSGLEANRVGNTIFVGLRLPDTARNVISRTLRLNQVDVVADAIPFLVAQGAETNEIRQTTSITSQGEGITAQSFTNTQTTVELLAADRSDRRYQGVAPLPLKGLLVAPDRRSNAVTLTGDPRKVEIAAALLSQLDVRKRQVAVNVKVVDINLNNVDRLNSSFSFGINDSFFVNDGGTGVLNFGGVNPPTAGTIGRPNVLVPPVINNPNAGAGVQFDRNSTITVPLTGPGRGGLFLRPIPGSSENPLDVRISEYEAFEVDADGTVTAGNATFSLPTLFQYPRKFLALLEAQVLSRNAKILTDPTLVVQEGATAEVRLTQQVLSTLTSTTTATAAAPVTTTTTEFADVGLILNIAVERIDDNGFITLLLNPEVSSPLAQVEVGDGFVTPVQRRTLSSGRLRLRDGQTLIVSGIIQDQDRTTVSKLPILGDLPLIGSLFRNTNRTNERAEVIIILTPQILDDSDNASYGYGYAPSPEAQQILNAPR